MTTKAKDCLVLLVLLLCTGIGTAEASRIRPLNLEELSQRASRIFSGRCVSVRVTHDAALDQEVTTVTFAPRRTVKGPAQGSVTIKLLGDLDAASPFPRKGVEGAPLFRKGEDVVLFLYGESRRGLTSPVGFSQGKFVVGPDKTGATTAVNGYANGSLFKGLSPEGERRLGAARGQGHGARPITEDRLLDLAETLLARGEGR